MKRKFRVTLGIIFPNRRNSRKYLLNFIEEWLEDKYNYWPRFRDPFYITDLLPRLKKTWLEWKQEEGYQITYHCCSKGCSEATSPRFLIKDAMCYYEEKV